MIRVRFAEDDRQRYGLPEWVDVDVQRPKLSEIRRIKAEIGWEWSQVDQGIDDMQDPDRRAAARAVLWWMIINRHNTVSWEDFDLDLFGVDVEAVETPNSQAPQGADS